MQYLRQSSTLRGLQGTRLSGARCPFAIRSSRSFTPIVAAARKKKSSDEEAAAARKLEKAEAVKKLQEDVNKEYGTGTMVKLTDKPERVPKFSTGLMSVDIMLGGGVPVGRVIEIFGPEGSGKTTLAWHFLAEAQQPDNYVQYIDLEYTLDREYTTILQQEIGLDPDRLSIVSPSNGDEAFDLMLKTMRGRCFSAMCIDSVASLVPSDDQESQLEDHKIATQARLMSKGVPRVVSTNSRAGDEHVCTMIFINQLRNKVGVLYGNPEVRPGGRALPYYSTVSIEVRAGKKIEDEKREIIGHKLKLKTVKNKVSPPFRVVELDLIYGKGICGTGSLLDGALQMEVVQQSGTFYSYKDERLGHGRAKAVDRLKMDAPLAEKIREATQAEFERRAGLNEVLPKSTTSAASASSSDSEEKAIRGSENGNYNERELAEDEAEEGLLA